VDFSLKSVDTGSGSGVVLSLIDRIDPLLGASECSYAVALYERRGGRVPTLERLDPDPADVPHD
jgi:hypothetical protein